MHGPHSTKRLYQRRDQWIAARRRCILQLAQWSLLVKTVAGDFTQIQLQNKCKPLEVAALELAWALRAMPDD